MGEVRAMEDFKYGMINFGEMRPLAKDSMLYLKGSIEDIKESYLTLGCHLCEFKRNEYYKDFGYDSFDECIKANLGMDKGSVSKCLNVCEKFADGMEIKEEYKEYNYSQLVEMVSMDNPEIITPDMTVKEIRKKKKELKISPADEKEEQEKLVKEEQKCMKTCRTREELMRAIRALLNGSMGFDNVFCKGQLYDQLENPREIYMDVNKTKEGLEAGKYKLVLQKVKEE